MNPGGSGPAHSPALPACISLCYDGSEPSHLETVIPCLTEFHLRATFYAHYPALVQRAAMWQAAMNEGHEMGSHSFFDAADEEGMLSRWTLETIEGDLRLGRKLLVELFPRQSDFSFAYPGPDPESMSVPYNPKPTSYRPAVAKVFDVARSANQGFNQPENCDLTYLTSIVFSGHSQGEMVDVAEQAVGSNSWALVVFGGVGSGHDSVDANEHRAFCAWLSKHSDDLQCETVLKRAARIRAWREAPGHAAIMELEEGLKPRRE